MPANITEGIIDHVGKIGINDSNPLMKTKYVPDSFVMLFILTNDLRPKS